MDTIVRITEEGATALWSDDLFAGNEDCSVVRASDVMPQPNGKWVVRLSDHHWNGFHKGRYLADGGTVEELKEAQLFTRRDEAIAAEVEFLNNMLQR